MGNNNVHKKIIIVDNRKNRKNKDDSNKVQGSLKKINQFPADDVEPKYDNLTDDQKKAYDELTGSNDNFFVTGKAGTGKSFLLRTYVQSLTNYVILAPTGIAAINVGGQTIHSFFSLSPTIQAAYDLNEVCDGLSNDKKILFKKLEILILDEVSMVRVDLMDMIDAKLKAARECSLPFGGCRVIAFGDLYQLPPVVEDDTDVNSFFADRYNTVFFFGAPVFHDNPIRIIELNEIMRQDEPEFKELLNAVRVGEFDGDILTKINDRRIDRPQDKKGVILVTTNNAAAKINQQKLYELNNELHIYNGKIDGKFDPDDLPTEMILELKEGAQIMLIKNAPGKWVNGTIGTVVRLSDDEIVVKLPNGVFSVDKETWVKYQYIYNPEDKSIEKEEIGWFTQFPIKLAYAITVHKSQGQTYDCVEVDYSEGHAFADGQTYVALSRCRKFSDLYLTESLTPEDIRICQEIKAFLNGSFEVKQGSDVKIPLIEKKEKRAEFSFIDDDRIEAKDYTAHKKITGTRFPSVLGLNRFESPFSVWCAIMHVYEKPFEDNIHTTAGRIIEPKQFEYVKRVMACEGRDFISPMDMYGEDYKEKTKYNFFGCYERFGGMWDYLAEKDGKTELVMEMKTAKADKRKYWQDNPPEQYMLQTALYAWMLGIDEFCLVCSFIKDNEYQVPDEYVCNEQNTIIRRFRLSEQFQDFEKEYVMPAVKWWDEYVATGISPRFDEVKDREVLNELRKIASESVLSKAPDESLMPVILDNIEPAKLTTESLESIELNSNDYNHTGENIFELLSNEEFDLLEILLTHSNEGLQGLYSRIYQHSDYREKYQSINEKAIKCFGEPIISRIESVPSIRYEYIDMLNQLFEEWQGRRLKHV